MIEQLIDPLSPRRSAPSSAESTRGELGGGHGLVQRNDVHDRYLVLSDREDVLTIAGFCKVRHNFTRALLPRFALCAQWTRMSALPVHVRTREIKYNAPPAKITTGVHAATAGGSSACSPNC